MIFILSGTSQQLKSERRACTASDKNLYRFLFSELTIQEDMAYEDGDLTYFIYTGRTKSIPSQELKNMLSFLVDSSDDNAISSELAAVRAMMNDIKHNL